MFLGTYYHSLDTKNRLTIPAKVLQALAGNGIVISKGLDGCLEMRTVSDFKMYADKLMALSQTKLNTRTICRQLLANAIELEVDSANRVLLPNNLLQEAQITKEVVIIGVGNKLEIWDSKKYEAFKKDTDGTLEELAEALDEHIL